MRRYFLYNVKLRLNDHFMQNWNGRLHESLRINVYNYIASVKFQSYLNVCIITKFRVSVSRLRLSAHRLCIETGRWTKPNSIPVVVGVAGSRSAPRFTQAERTSTHAQAGI